MPKISRSNTKRPVAKGAQKAGNGPQRPDRKRKTAPGASSADPRPRTRKNGATSAATARALGSSTVRPGTKLAAMIALLDRKEGATIGDLQQATGWQAHSVRGAISGALKKKLGFDVAAQQEDGRGRTYRIVGRPGSGGQQ